MKRILIVDVPEGYELTQELAMLSESGKFDVKTVKYTEFTPPSDEEIKHNADLYAYVVNSHNDEAFYTGYKQALKQLGL